MRVCAEYRWYIIYFIHKLNFQPCSPRADFRFTGNAHVCHKTRIFHIDFFGNFVTPWLKHPASELCKYINVHVFQITGTPICSRYSRVELIS